MGHGIAEVALLADYFVSLHDIDDEIINRGKSLIDWSLKKFVEKSQITEIIHKINEGYLAGEISTAELGLIFESMAKCPALTIGLVTQFEQSYVAPSGLSSAEKLAADTQLNRLARGLSNGKIGWEIVETILVGISYVDADGTHQLKAPADVSDEEIRDVLVAVKNAADDAGISEMKVEIDISDEFKKTVEHALGRSLS